MQLEARKYLYDIQRASDFIARFCEGKDFQQYQADDLLKSAVERQFEIIGEALSKLAKSHPETAESLPEYRRIIAFRNILIHGYATVDDKIVWGVIENYLTPLRATVTDLLEQ